jgi:hypothetical protein
MRIGILREKHEFRGLNMFAFEGQGVIETIGKIVLFILFIYSYFKKKEMG